MTNKSNLIDVNQLKFNQISIITFLLLGFILNLEILVYFTALIMIIGSIIPKFAVFKQIYKNIVLKNNLIKPNIIEDSQAPHNFAQLLGGIVLAIAGSLFLLNISAIGWIFVWVVILLAFINVAFNFCMGCFIYYQIHRLKVRGLNKQTQKV